MTREWLAIYTAMVTKVKYKRLSPIGRGALLHTFLLAGFRSPEATWRDPDELRESLILEGFPEGAMDELTGLGWLEHDDGALVIHDWDQHQIAANLEVKRTWEADRKRDWRRRPKRSDSAPTPSPAPPTPTEHNNTPHNRYGDMSPNVPVPKVDQVVTEYQGLFGHVTDAKRLYLADIASRWPVDRVLEGIRVEHRNGATSKTICGRLEAGLKGGDKARDQATWTSIGESLSEATA